MSTNPNVGKAIFALQARKENRSYISYNGKALTWREIAEALDAAGLLVSPLHERALRACERYAEDHPSYDPAYVEGACCSVLISGRESLAAKKPKEPHYEAFPATYRAPGVNPPYRVGIKLSDGLSQVVTLDLTEQQARAVAAALNALEQKS